jgi:hypothetical protein
MSTIRFNSEVTQPEQAWPASQITGTVPRQVLAHWAAKAFSSFIRSIWLNPSAAADAVQYFMNCLLVIFTVYSLLSEKSQGVQFYLLFIIDFICHDLNVSLSRIVCKGGRRKERAFPPPP